MTNYNFADNTTLSEKAAKNKEKRKKMLDKVKGNRINILQQAMKKAARDKGLAYTEEILFHSGVFGKKKK